MDVIGDGLDLLDDEDAAWFAKAQRLFYGLRVHVPFGRLGGVPGRAEPYGYSACDSGCRHGLIAAVNPSQAVATLALPGEGEKSLLFRDAGFEPKLDKNGIPVKIKDVAKVQFGPDIRRGVAELNGEGEVVGGIVLTDEGLESKFGRALHHLTVADMAGIDPSALGITAGANQSNLALESLSFWAEDDGTPAGLTIEASLDQKILGMSAHETVTLDISIDTLSGVTITAPTS